MSIRGSRMFGYMFEGAHRAEGDYGPLTPEMDFAGQQVYVRITGTRSETSVP